MRLEMEEELHKTLREIALKLRTEHGLTQARMSEALSMSERSYEEIERGKSACGALTATLLLLKLEEYPELKALLLARLTKAYAVRGALA